MKEEISMGKLVKLIGKVIGREIIISTDERRIRPEKSEVERLLCENTKIMAYTNWQPQYNLEKGVKETVAWLKENIHLYKPEIYNV